MAAGLLGGSRRSEMKRWACRVGSQRSDNGIEVLVCARPYEGGRAGRRYRGTDRQGCNRQESTERDQHTEQPADNRLVHETIASH